MEKYLDKIQVQKRQTKSEAEGIVYRKFKGNIIIFITCIVYYSAIIIQYNTLLALLSYARFLIKKTQDNRKNAG